MLRKLYSAVSGASCADNPDSPQHHEVLLPGYLYGMIIKERFDECLNTVKAQINLDLRQKKTVDFSSRKPSLCSGPDPSSLLPNCVTKNKLGHWIQTLLLPSHG